MPSNAVLSAAVGIGITAVLKQISHDGDTAQLPGSFIMGISGTEDAYTAGAINGDATNGLDVDVTRVIPGTDATHLGKAEDAVHASGDTGVFLLAVRKDTAAATGTTDGNYTALVTDPTGRLWCNVSNTVTVGSHAVTNAGTFVIQIDGAALTALQLIDDCVSGTEMQVDIVAALPAGANLIGDVGLSGARTSGGATLFANNGTSTKTQIKATAGQIYWLHCINLNATVVYLQIFNLASANVTLGTTIPDLQFPVPTAGSTNGAGFNLPIPNGQAFGTGITYAITTTKSGATAATADTAFINGGYA